MLEEITKDGKLVFRLYRVVHTILIIVLAPILLITLGFHDSFEGSTPLVVLLLSTFGYYNVSKIIKKEEPGDRPIAHIIFIFTILIIITTITIGINSSPQ